MTAETLHTEAAEQQPVVLSLAEAKEILGRVVEKVGPGHRYVDEEPKYFDPETGKCSCIVGHVLAEKGITMLDLEQRIDGGNTREVYSLVRAGVIRVDSATESLLAVVQTEQDVGRPWKASLDEALATYEEFEASQALASYEAYDYQA